MNGLLSIQTCVEILRALRSGDLADVPRQSHLTTLQREEALSWLKESSLIEQEEGSDRYKITRAGIEYFEAYDKFIKVLSGKKWNKVAITAQA